MQSARFGSEKAGHRVGHVVHHPFPNFMQEKKLTQLPQHMYPALFTAWRHLQGANMDLLPLPTGRGRVAQAPFVGFALTEWDGGQFMHFACRIDQSGCVPRQMRTCSCAETTTTANEFLDLEKKEATKIAAIEERKAIFQHWLFFGLLAEFHGLNDPSSHDSHQNPSMATAERARSIRKLYDTFVKNDVITSASLFEENGGKQMVGHLLQNRDPENLVARFRYLHECLGFVSNMLHALSAEGPTFLDPSTVLSIAGLVELLASSLSVLNTSQSETQYVTSSTGILAAKFLDPRSDASDAMANSRWCRSDVERIRHIFFGISTRYFLSHLEKPETSYTHSVKTCSFARCGAAQIDPCTYKLSHVEDCKACDLAGLDENEVKRILMQTTTFPILRLVLHDQGGVDIYVEEYMGAGTGKRRPYVALSHVS